jgi:hypothetical protein
MRRFAVGALFLLGIVVLAGCNPTQGTPSGPAPTAPGPTMAAPDATRASSPTATLERAVTFPEVSLVQDPRGGWLVMGLLENQARYAIGDVSLSLVADGPSPGSTIQVSGLAARSAIPAGAQSPFLIELRSTARPTGVEVRAQSWTRLEFSPPSLTVDSIRSWATADGRDMIGSIGNAGGSPVFLAGLSLITRGPQGEITAFGQMRAGPAVLAPGANIPFLADIYPGADAQTYSFFPDTRESELTQVVPDLRFTWGPTLRQDPQGNPFLIGEVENEGPSGAWFSALFGLELEGEWLSAVHIGHPLPLRGGERRAFISEDLPGLRAYFAERDGDISSVQVKAWIDPPSPDRPDLGTSPLAVEIDAYEEIGSAIYLRGNLTNPGEVEVFQPTVHGTIWNTNGDLISTGWSTSQASLPPGGSAAFILRLPLSAGVDPTFFEPYVWAAGLPTPPPHGPD